MNTGEKPGKILIILNKIPILILTPFILCILIVSFFKRAEFCAYKHGDKPVWIAQNIPLLILTVILLLFGFILVFKLCEKLKRFERRQVVCMIIYLSVIIQVFYILFIPAKQFADQNIVNDLALKLLAGNYDTFNKGGYIYMFPNNAGITLFLAAIYKIFPHTMLVPKLLNVVFSTFTSYFTFRIYEELYHPVEAKSYGILVFAGFYLPMIFLNNLVYNDVYATTLFAGFVYYCIRFVKSRKGYNLVVAGIFVAAGNFLRQVGILFIIAAALYFIINRINVISSVTYLIVLTIMLNVPLCSVNTYLSAKGKISEPIGLNSIPIHMWINIGMNEKKFGYWDDSTSYFVYLRDGQSNKAKSEQIYSQLIKNNIEEKGIKGIAKTYIKKNAWLWTEGTYQAEYYGIGSWGYLYPTFASEYVKNNLQLRDLVRWILHSTNLSMLVLIFVGLFRSIVKRRAYPLTFAAIILLGFICFYTIWEIKPRYIYPVYPYLILMFYYGLSIICNKRKSHKGSFADSQDDV